MYSMNVEFPQQFNYNSSHGESPKLPRSDFFIKKVKSIFFFDQLYMRS